jgi:hypothetical protein
MMTITFRVFFIFKMATIKISKISMFSGFNENWYLGLFWSEELIFNDENCIQGNFYFQNGRCCHGNRERVSKSLTSLISEAAKGFPQDLAYILSRVGRIFWPKQIANEGPTFLKWPPTKSAKFQCSLVSMKIYI